MIIVVVVAQCVRPFYHAMYESFDVSTLNFKLQRFNASVREWVSQPVMTDATVT